MTGNNGQQRDSLETALQAKAFTYEELRRLLSESGEDASETEIQFLADQMARNVSKMLTATSER